MPANAIAERVGSGRISPHQIIIILICFMINVIDGFDILAMSYAAPSLSSDWGVEPAELGIIFSSALFGMTLGALVLSPLGDKFGRRILILASLAGTSICMLITPLTSSITELVIVRFLTGLGIGGVLAPIVSLATEYAPTRFSNYAVILVQSGYAVGSVLGGVVAGIVIPSSGWESVFWYGGVFTGILCIASVFFLPESIEYLATKRVNAEMRLRQINRILERLKKPALDTLPELASNNGSSSSLASLWNEHKLKTIQLWIIFFAAVWLTYFLLNWIPVLYVNGGLTQADGIQALTFYTLGSLIGAQVLGLASAKLDVQKIVGSTFILTVVLLVVFTQVDKNSSLVMNTVVISLGFVFGGGFTTLYALAAQIYPAHVRATGVGWCIGIGRFGSILSPLVIGFMVSACWSMSELILAIATPPLVVATYFVYRLRA